MFGICNMLSSNQRILRKGSTEGKSVKMSHQKLTYADILKNQSGFLNPGMNPTPLTPKPARVRLSEEAKAKLRSAIKEESSAEVKPGKSAKFVKPTRKSSKEKTVSQPATNCSQPLVLATASD